MKGIGIILVMLGHTHIFYGACQLPLWCNRIIDSFHVPMFFIIAGYFSKTYDYYWKDTLRKYVKRLLFPFLITAGIVLVYNAAVAVKRNDLNLLLGVIGAYLIGDPTHRIPDTMGFPYDMGVGPAWFLWALFWAKIAFLFISRANKWTELICIIVSIGCALFSISYTLPFGLLQGGTALGFLAIGHWCRNHHLPTWMIVLCVFCWVASLVWNIPISPYSAYYPIYPFNLLSVLGASLCVFWLSKQFARLSWIKMMFKSLGRNSLNLICVHTVDMRCNLIRLGIKTIIPGVVATLPWTCLVLDYFVSIIAAFFVQKKQIQKLIDKCRKSNEQ